jgi:4-aminobutyrate aminotransferase-like enzyme
MVKPEFKPFNINVDRTDRFRVIASGKEFLDFSGSAMTTGYNFIKNEWLVSPVSKLIFDNEYVKELSLKLKSVGNFNNIAYTTSGTEACDAALSRYGEPFLALEGAYHGLTYITGLVSNGNGFDKKNNIIHLKSPDSFTSTEEAIDYSGKLIKNAYSQNQLNNGSIIIELVQSDGGINIISQKFIDYINSLVEDYNLKLIVDEVYTGYGRSGDIMLFKKFKIKPDMVCLGKGMAAGLPLGAVLYNGDWKLPYNQVISMQSANLFTSRVAVEVLKSLNERRLKFVRNKGNEIIQRLKSIKNNKIYSVRGIGFMIGIEFRNANIEPDGIYAYKIRCDLESKGLICSLTGEFNNVLKVTPPVLIDEKSLEYGINILEQVLSENP